MDFFTLLIQDEGDVTIRCVIQPGIVRRKWVIDYMGDKTNATI